MKQPEHEPKLKEVKITVQFKSWADLRMALLEAKHQVQQGQQYVEGTKEKASYTASLEFLELTDYTEIKINEKWHRIIKSKI